MWSSDGAHHHAAPLPPRPGSRSRLWSALLLFAVGVVTLAVLAVVALAIVLGGYHGKTQQQEDYSHNRRAPSATWGEEAHDAPHQLLYRPLPTQPPQHHKPFRRPPRPLITTSTTSSTSTSTSTTTSSPPVVVFSEESRGSLQLPSSYSVRGSVDFQPSEPKKQQEWHAGHAEPALEQEWRAHGEASVVQEPELLTPERLPSRSYSGVNKLRPMPTLFPSTTPSPKHAEVESPFFLSALESADSLSVPDLSHRLGIPAAMTTNIPDLNHRLEMIDSISKSFVNVAIRVRNPNMPQIMETVPPTHILEVADLVKETETKKYFHVSNTTSSSLDAQKSEETILPVTIIPKNTEELENKSSLTSDPEILISTLSNITEESSNTSEPNFDEEEPIILISRPEEDRSFASESEFLVPTPSESEPDIGITEPENLVVAANASDVMETTEESGELTTEPEIQTTDFPSVFETTVDSFYQDMSSLLLELATTVSPQQLQMTSRAALTGLERTAKQDPTNIKQYLLREPKTGDTLVPAFPKSEFNSLPAFLRNQKRNTTAKPTTTTTPTIDVNCTCAARLEAQGLNRKLCDGVVDCWDFTDEERCDWCSQGQYVCAHSRACVPRHKLCDGKRDCPFGDDERSCVAIAPDRKRADTIEYHEDGLLMVQQSGAWGPLCVEKLETTAWRLGDVARAVCRALTYSDFELAEQVIVEQKRSGPYYELNLQRDTGRSGTPRLAVSSSECPSRSAVRLGCRDLQCGVRPLAVSQWARRDGEHRRRGYRIVGGGNAGPGAWPWQAALYKEGQFQCGGSLIAAQWLLSASHCFAHNLDAYWVARLGALRRGTDLSSPFEQLRRVIRIIQHPGYMDHGFVNDLALLRLEKPVKFSDYVRPVCLPPATPTLANQESEDAENEGQMCTVVGWGQLSEVGRIFPDTLQEVQLPLISTEECRKRTLFLPLYRVTEDMFCAGYERGGRDACLGDSGGPLMCQRPDGHWELTGITSNGYGCARANRPGVYTKVANYIRWIGGVLEDQSFENMTSPELRCPNGQQRCALGQCTAPAATTGPQCAKMYCPPPS